MKSEHINPPYVDIKSIDDASCFILTKNRLHIVEYVVDYYSSWFEKIYVLDASDSPESHLIHLLSSKAHLYLLPGTSVFHRLSLVKEIAATKYILVAPDDDLIVCSEVANYLDILNSKNHSVLYGDILSVATDNQRKPVFFPAWIWSSKYDVTSIETITEKLYFTTRLIQTSRFFWTLYDSNHFACLCDYLRQMQPSIFSLEYAVAFFNIIHGNPFYTNNFFYIRNNLHDSVDKARGQKKQQGDESAKDIYLASKSQAINRFIHSISSFRPIETITEHHWNIIANTIKNVEENPQDHLIEFMPDVLFLNIKASHSINHVRGPSSRAAICFKDEKFIKHYFTRSLCT